MLALCGCLISNDAKWPHELMCSRVKRGRPGQPLTSGSFIRLRSKHVPIDKGRCKGHRFSLFTSIQLTHQPLNHRSVFIKTLCPLIPKQFTHSVQLSATHHLLFLSFFSFCNVKVKVCNDEANPSFHRLGQPCGSWFPSDFIEF